MIKLCSHAQIIYIQIEKSIKFEKRSKTLRSSIVSTRTYIMSLEYYQRDFAINHTTYSNLIKYQYLQK